ncbi:amino acid ABC transporter substrate-binding protein, partial [Maribellus luteus]
MQASVSRAFSLSGLAPALAKSSRQVVGVVIGAALAVAVLHAPQAHADKLDDIKKAGVL